MIRKQIEGVWTTIKKFFASLYFALRYVTFETLKRYGSSLVGLITVIIVVFVVGFLAHTITKTGVIFFKLSEDQAGDADVILTPAITNSSTLPFLNHTEIHQRLVNNSLLSGTSPRWTIFGQILNRDNRNKNSSGILLLVDTDNEPKIGEGRFWTSRALGEAECHVSDGLLKATELPPNKGSKVIISIDFSTLARTAGIATGSTGLIPFFLASQGVNLNQNVSVNLLQILDQFQVPLNPFIRQILNATGPTQIPLSTLLNVLSNSSNTQGAFAISSEYSVVDSVYWANAKYTSALGNIMMIDSKYFTKSVQTSLYQNPFIILLFQLLPQLRTQLDQAFANFKIQEYALQVIGIHKYRYDVYVKNEEPRNNDMIEFSNSIINDLGVDYPVTITLPIVTALSATTFISLFLDQIFIGVVAMIAVLGIILIYTILIGKVEEKTYEYGMLRALGLPQNSLIQVILAQSMFFAVPGVIIGMILAWLIGILVNFIILTYAKLPTLSVLLGTYASFVPILLGFFIPILANIIPIRRALSRQLRDSLDIAHQSMNDTTVRMIKLAELGLEPWQTMLSVLLIVCGFIVYYVIPYSFIFSNLPLFFLILNVILLGMLFGLCMVASVVQPLLEKIVLFCILWCKDRRLMTLISKNLAGHRSRSRKTFLMFVLAISFIIFAGVSFSLQNASIVSNVEALVGADLVAQSFAPTVPINIQNMNPHLEKLKKQGLIIDYAYQTFSLTRGNPFITQSRFSTLAYYPTRLVNVFGLTKNFLSVTRSYYFLYTEYDRSFSYSSLGGNKVDAIDSLYTHQGQAVVDGEQPGYAPQRIYSGRKLGVSINDSLAFDPAEKYRQYLDIVVSEAMRDELSVKIKTPLQIKVAVTHPRTRRSSSQDFISKARAMVYKVPGFFFSSYRFASSGSPVLISIDAYKNITTQAAKSVDYNEDGYTGEPKYEKLFVKFRPGLTGDQKIDISNSIKSFLDRDLSSILMVEDLIAQTNSATTVIIGFYNLVAVIAILLCFFTLTLSFEANVRENSWEFGVIRSIGLSVNALIRAYIYEALCLVISSLICGTIIGTTIAMTLTAQFNLFLEMPFQFDFPYYLFASLIVMSVVVAVLGSWIPARILKRQEIALVIRGM